MTSDTSVRVTPVNESIRELLDEVAVFGGSAHGVNRFAWSPELFDAYAWLSDKMAEHGLIASVDAAGNLIGRWEVGSGKPLVLGSHLDTVPNGGRYDGTLGVLAAFLSVRLLQDAGVQPSRPVWVVAFMDEEGARFGTTLFGSRAFVGEDLTMLGERTDAGGTSLRSAMSKAGFDFDRLSEAARVSDVHAYLELHIEQGPVLDEGQVDIGVVTGIVGLRGFRGRFVGQANHAGTTPMSKRRDALAGVSRVVLKLRDAAMVAGNVTTNVGYVAVEPGGANVVPGIAEFTIDARCSEHEGFEGLEGLVRETISLVAQEEQLEYDLSPTFELPPVRADNGIVETLLQAAADVGAHSEQLPSGAGHDAMALGRFVPMGMLFVPSIHGISHSPDEYTSLKSCEIGVRVLARAVELLVAREEQV